MSSSESIIFDDSFENVIFTNEQNIIKLNKTNTHKNKSCNKSKLRRIGLSRINTQKLNTPKNKRKSCTKFDGKHNSRILNNVLHKTLNVLPPDISDVDKYFKDSDFDIDPGVSFTEQTEKYKVPETVLEQSCLKVSKNVQINGEARIRSQDEKSSENFQSKSVINDSRGQSSILNSQELCKLENWGLPQCILDKYAERGIKSMFPWQVECLQATKVLTASANLVYSAPTSAGKTLVAEILTIKTVIERKKKVLIILPFVSVVREKMFYFQDILGSNGVRVEGFMGSYNPPGGFSSVQVAICTIEKANNIVNRLLAEGSLSDIGAVVIDELHLLGDPSRGYILELLLTKLKYMTMRNTEMIIQLVGMSATLPNLSLLATWLHAELYKTDFRPIPLYEQCYANGSIYDSNLKELRKVEPHPDIPHDTDNIIQFCLETIYCSCSVLIFCTSKNWCESLAQQISGTFQKIGRSDAPLGACLREQLCTDKIVELLEQLRRCPVGLDAVLKTTVSFGVAFHHAGLTMDERDIIEGAFRKGALRVLVATSTLSSGVNLPARRVIIRSPMFAGRPIDTLTYRQMIGRAGRMGKDCAGESILVCQPTERRVAQRLLSAELRPISSCLEGSGKLKRAILEVIASGVATTPDDVQLFTECTLLAASEDIDELDNPIGNAVEFLHRNEFIRLQTNPEGELHYIASPLAKACLSSSMPPEEGLTLFSELEKARQCFVLESELHIIYLVTPYSTCQQWTNLDWTRYYNMWEKLPSSDRRVAELIGVSEAFIIRSMTGKQDNEKMFTTLQIHRRFYTALALQELVQEVPLNDVASKYQCNRGVLQSLQQSAATFAGMVTAFSRQLGWSTIEILVAQFQDRLQFGVNRELLDLMRLPSLNGIRARALFNAGIETVVALAAVDVCDLENVLHSAVPFQSEKERDGETAQDAVQRKQIKTVWITGKQGLTEREAAEMLVSEARCYLKYEIGLSDAKWGRNDELTESQTSNRDITVNTQMGTNMNESDMTQQFVSLATLNVSHTITSQTNKEHTRKVFEDIPSDMSEVNESIHISMVQTPMVQTLALKSNSPEFVQSNELTNGKELEVTPKRSTVLKRFNESPRDSGDTISIKRNIKETKFTDNFEWSPIQIDQKTITKSPVELIRRSAAAINCTNRLSDNFLNHTNQSGSLFEDSLMLDTNICGMLDQSIPKTPLILIQTEDGKSSKSISNSAPRSNCIDSGVAMSVPEQGFTSTFNFDATNSMKLNVSEDDIVGNSEDSMVEVRSPFVSRTNSSKPLLITTRKLRGVRKGNSSRRKREMSAIQDPAKEVVPRSDESIQSVLCGSYLQKHDDVSVDLTTMDIIDVCGDRQLFETVSAWILTRTEIAFGMCCEKYAESKVEIGVGIRRTRNRNSLRNMNGKVYFCGEFQVTGFSVCCGVNSVYYFALTGNAKVLAVEVVELFKRIFAKTNLTVRQFDAKELIKMLYRACEISVETKCMDPKVFDWMLQPEGKEKNLQAMALQYAPEAVGLAKLVGGGQGVGSIAFNTNCSISGRLRACVESIVTWFVVEAQNEIRNEQETWRKETVDVEMNTILTLARMELCGLGVSLELMQSLSQRFQEMMTIIEKQAYYFAGRNFSISSPADVAKVLKMRGRKVSTSKQVLQKSDSPIAALVLQWRKLSGTLTKMLLPIIRSIEAGRIHGTCDVHSSTGRISMYEPNLQNVPRDFELLVNGSSTNFSIRNAFTPRDGCVVLSADYCQLELRLLAHLAQDELLCSVMRSGEDVFKSIAAEWNHIPLSQVDDELRQRAKHICYGIIYGMGAKALGEQLKIQELEAAEFIETFKNTYPQIRLFVQETIEKCRRLGYVETLNGRRRYLPHINHTMPSIKSQAERQAVNTTIQGSAADIAKMAMVLVESRLRAKYPWNLKNQTSTANLVLNLHDELLYEVSINLLEDVARSLKTSMEEAVCLSIPFPVKVKCGKSWGELSEMHV